MKKISNKRCGKKYEQGREGGGATGDGSFRKQLYLIKWTELLTGSKRMTGPEMLSKVNFIVLDEI